MSDLSDDQNAADVGRVNQDLVRGLRRCSGIVRDYRTRLIAANSNEAGFMLSGEAADDGEHEPAGPTND